MAHNHVNFVLQSRRFAPNGFQLLTRMCASSKQFGIPVPVIFFSDMRAHISNGRFLYAFWCYAAC